MVSTANPLYYPSSPETPDWLDAMFGDRALIDPRTFEVHNALWAPLIRFSDPRRVTRRNLAKLGHQSNYFFVHMWVEKTVVMIRTKKYEPVPVDIIDDEDDDLDSESQWTDSDESTFEDELSYPLQLEAVPPYPKQSLQNTLFETHLQTSNQGFFNPDLIDSRSLTSSAEENQHSLHPTLEFDATTIDDISGISYETSGAVSDEKRRKRLAAKFRRLVTYGVDICRSMAGGSFRNVFLSFVLCV
ncbi:hypothetical protein N7540_008096 [Penicillium herquei]|nr:hypothetical protein N7540_008096 [Penicillium herquei]